MSALQTVSQQFYGSGGGGSPSHVVYDVTGDSPEVIRINLGGRVAGAGGVQVTHNGLVLNPERSFIVFTGKQGSTLELTVPRDSLEDGDTLVVTAHLL